jgi:hypothetical protein
MRQSCFAGHSVANSIIGRNMNYMANGTNTKSDENSEQMQRILEAIAEARRRIFELSNQMIREGRHDISGELDRISGILYRATIDPD